MRIIKIAQSQSMSQSQSMDLSQEHSINLDEPGFYGERSSVLPKTTAVLKASRWLLGKVDKTSKETGYQCPQDFLLANVVPELIPHIKAYYAGRGNKMCDQLSPTIINKVDSFIEIWLGKALAKRR